MNPIPFNNIKEFINGETGNGCELITTEQEFESEKELRKQSNSRVELKIRCKCGSIFYKTFKAFCNNVHPRKQCPKCGRKLRADSRIKNDYSDEIQKLYEKGFEVHRFEKEFDAGRKRNNTYFYMTDKESYKYKIEMVSIHNFLNGQYFGFDKFNFNSPFAKENIENWLKLNLNSYSLLTKNYEGTKKENGLEMWGKPYIPNEF